MGKKKFDVVVERDGKWWVFDIPELGTGGQAYSLGDVEFEAQGVAAMWLDIDPETCELENISTFSLVEDVFSDTIEL